MATTEDYSVSSAPLRVEPDSYDKRDWRASVVFKTVRSSTLPDKLDLSKQMLPPRNQGGIGACGAFSACGIKHWQERKDTGIYEYFSAIYFYLWRPNYPKGGMTARGIMEVLSKYGTCLEKTAPYPKDTRDRSAPERKRSFITTEMIQEGKNFRIKSFARCERPKDVIKALNTSGPVLLTVPVYKADKRMWKPRPGYQTPKGGHAMCIVGYDKEKRVFKVRNSWGPTWGDGTGHCYLPFGHWGYIYDAWTVVDRYSQRIEGANYDPIA